MKLAKKPLALLLAAVLFLGSLVGCGLYVSPEEPEEVVEDASTTPTPIPIDTSIPTDGRLSISYVPGEPFNPFTGTNRDNLAIGGLLYEGLFALDEQFTAVPVLVQSMTTLDGRQYTLELRSDVTFHNGIPLTVADVIYSLDRARASALFGGRLGVITGYERRFDAQGEPLEFEMEITLGQTHGNLPVLLTFPIIQQGTFYWAAPPGTGPYRYLDDGTSRLERFDGHRHSNELPVDTIYLTNIATNEQLTADFNAGLLDVVPIDPTTQGEYRLAPTREIRNFESSLMDYIGFNLNRPETARREVRLAISRAIDRAYITNNIMRGGAVPSPLPFHPAVSYFDDQLAAEFRFDMSLAQQILAGQVTVPRFELPVEDTDDYDNGYPTDDTPQEPGEPREYEYGNVPALEDEDNDHDRPLPQLTLLVASGNTMRMEIAVYIADSISELGYQVIIDERPHSEFMEALEDGHFDIFYGQVRLQPDFNLTPVLRGELAFGALYQAMPQRVIDEFLASGQPDRSERATAMAEAVLLEVPIMVIGFRNMAVATQRGIVSGLTPTQENMFYRVWDWIVDV
ncbi:MAG: ABC transporter substrate-binding protein [Oscillospiraceae bacterium]|nr:ABC transporter substrate-binding protein [Oscillospiraceae bacterium]